MENDVLANLQALRAMAAVSVVVFHVGLMPPTSLPFTAGAAGVDLFFVLSGFIIAFSSSRDPRHFVGRRLIRIVPAYWIATIIAAAFALEQMDRRDVADWLVQSLFYLPDPTGRPALIFVAWTLVYELAFYLLYWLALRTGVGRAPPTALSALVVFSLVPIPGLTGPSPLLLEFAIGLAVYLATERLGLGRRYGKIVGPLTCGAGLVLVPLMPLLTVYGPDDGQSLIRVLTWGLPMGAIVLGAVISERSGLAVTNRLVLMLGDASYAIYLLHPIAVGQLLKLSSAPQPFSSVACLGTTAAIAVVSVGFHRVVEAPLLRGLRLLVAERAPTVN